MLLRLPPYILLMDFHTHDKSEKRKSHCDSLFFRQVCFRNSRKRKMDAQRKMSDGITHFSLSIRFSFLDITNCHDDLRDTLNQQSKLEYVS